MFHYVVDKWTGMTKAIFHLYLFLSIRMGCYIYLNWKHTCTAFLKRSECWLSPQKVLAVRKMGGRALIYCKVLNFRCLALSVSSWQSLYELTDQKQESDVYKQYHSNTSIWCFYNYLLKCRVTLPWNQQCTVGYVECVSVWLQQIHGLVFNST